MGPFPYCWGSVSDAQLRLTFVASIKALSHSTLNELLLVASRGIPFSRLPVAVTRTDTWQAWHTLMGLVSGWLPLASGTTTAAAIMHGFYNLDSIREGRIVTVTRPRSTQNLRPPNHVAARTTTRCCCHKPMDCGFLLPRNVRILTRSSSIFGGRVAQHFRVCAEWYIRA